ncbi:GntR family transcriptional regulator [Cerasicoccus frondis]|uniref:GntR family transcriptional regulator n=1 Tax=Cerasicoccus frondis TaxID=490090 RepID=UPI00285282F4|nr:GntR family transcriptional regulator [Cerasicoccus frondis]
MSHSSQSQQGPQKAFGNTNLASTHNHLAATSKRVRKLYRELLHYISTNNLNPGDLLPKHEELRQELKTGSNMLHEAISMLVSDGVLERVRGTGTRLIRTDIVSLQTWTVGVPIFDDLVYGFEPMLEHYLRRALIKNGCSDRTYVLKPTTRKELSNYKPEHFAGLEDDIAAQQIDAVLTFHPFACDKLPVCCVATEGRNSSMKVNIDDSGFVEGAIHELNKRNLKNIAVIGPERYNTRRKAHLKKKKINQKLTWIDQAGRGGIDAGIHSAEEYLKLSNRKPIDAIIILDEIMANTMLQIVQNHGQKLPVIALQCNQQVPIPIIGPEVIRFELDILKLAESAVDCIVKKLMDPTTKVSNVLVRPTLIEDS